MPQGLDQLDRLTILDLSNCNSIKALDQLTSTRALEWLDISELTELEAIPETMELPALKHLNAMQLGKLKQLPKQLISGSLKLEVLDVTGAVLLKELPPVDNLTAIKRLTLDSCERMTELPKGFEALKSLCTLEVRECKSLRRLADLISLPNLSLWCSRIRDWTSCRIDRHDAGGGARRVGSTCLRSLRLAQQMLDPVEHDMLDCPASFACLICRCSTLTLIIRALR